MKNANVQCILGTTALVLILDRMPAIGIIIVVLMLLYSSMFPTPTKGTLRIKVLNPRFRDFFERRAKAWNESKRRDSGFDVPTPEFTPGPGENVCMLDLGFAAAATTASGEPTEILLLSRSSNKDYPLTNGIGLLDSGYRGEVKASVRVFYEPGYETIEEGTRLFQLYAPGLGPGFTVVIVDDLGETERGIRGFGSTGMF